MAVAVAGYFIFAFAATSNAKYLAPQTIQSCGKDPCWCPGQTQTDISQKGAMEYTMRCMINYARKVRGVQELGEGGDLDASTIDKNRDIVACNQFSHTACGRTKTYWFFKDGFLPGGSYWQAGENLAWGTGSSASPRSVMTAWVNSPDHLANILNPKFQAQGVSVRLSANLFGRSSVYTWVSHLGCHNSLACQ
jgi:uncharacterized protein YkwD